MRERHDNEYEMVHNGSGLSEELPSQLQTRQAREERRLFDARETIGIAQWLRVYPDTERTHFLVAHEPIDNEIIQGLQDKDRLRAIAQAQTAVRPEAKMAEDITYSSQKHWDQLAARAQPQTPTPHQGEVVQQTQQQLQRDQQNNAVVQIQRARHTLTP